MGNFISNVFNTVSDGALQASRMVFGIPLPTNVYPVLIPSSIIPDEEPVFGGKFNQFTPMTFFLAISRNLNPLIAVSAAVAATQSNGVNTVRGVADSIGLQKEKSFKDFDVLAQTSYIPSSAGANAGAQLTALRQIFIPPLTLLVNPQDLSFSFPNIISRSNARQGTIEEYLGNDLLKIQANGTSAGFYTSKSGLNNEFKVQSPGFQNLMSLYMIYRNNGCDFFEGKTNTIYVVGAVIIFYDGVFYTGCFEDFQIMEDATNPFRLRYSFTFTVRSRVRSLLSDAVQNLPFTAAVALGTFLAK